MLENFFLRILKGNNKNINLLNDSLKKGDKRAYQILFDKYYVRLVSYINTYTKNEDNSKDIVQESFIKLWNNRATIEADASVVSFLHKIAYNIFIDRYRKQKRNQSLLDALSYEAINESIEYEEESTKVQKIEMVKKSVEELPPRCQEIFKMSKYEGLKYVEIAETLNLSIKTVEAQMGKAFSYIRKKVKELDSK